LARNHPYLNPGSRQFFLLLHSLNYCTVSIPKSKSLHSLKCTLLPQAGREPPTQPRGKELPTQAFLGKEPPLPHPRPKAIFFYCTVSIPKSKLFYCTVSIPKSTSLHSLQSTLLPQAGPEPPTQPQGKELPTQAFLGKEPPLPQPSPKANFFYCTVSILKSNFFYCTVSIPKSKSLYRLKLI
jgi:hypothetical protein